MRRPAAAMILTASLFTLLLTVHAFAVEAEEGKEDYPLVFHSVVAKASLTPVQVYGGKK